MTADGSNTHFFSTQAEDSPWIEFDLGSIASISYVRVINRLDCCQERAVPLVIEVADQRRTWSEVARREESFVLWSATFRRRPARYVRLRVARPSILHLSYVEIQ